MQQLLCKQPKGAMQQRKVCWQMLLLQLLVVTWEGLKLCRLL
jgi:hypothetical protein